MACTQEMLRVNICQNLQVVIQIATKYSDVLGPVGLIKMFESFKTFEGEHCILITIFYAFIMSNRSLLLPRIYCQPQRGSRGSLQIYSGHHSYRSDSRRRNSRTSFCSSLSVIGSILFMISFSIRTVSPNLSRYMFSESTL